ncbi:hypothetical protein ACHAXA_006557 [Cyclostephanos tholiformis]|uniref:Uncharacterized protein n=1 Tax=Cyclostephanos tholiformis TaxID=382380 RepID=A0ABD3RB39_9STRA
MEKRSDHRPGHVEEATTMRSVAITDQATTKRCVAITDQATTMRSVAITDQATTMENENHNEEICDAAHPPAIGDGNRTKLTLSSSSKPHPRMTTTTADEPSARDDNKVDSNDDDISSDGDAEVGGKGKGGEKREEDDNVDDDYGEQRDGKMMGMGSTMLRAACQSNLEETCGIEKRGRFPTGYMDEPVLFPLFCVKEIMMPPEEVPTYHDDVSLFMHMFPFQEYDDWAKSAMKQQYDLGGSRACDRTSKLLEACEHNNMEINFCKGTADAAHPPAIGDGNRTKLTLSSSSKPHPRMTTTTADEPSARDDNKVDSNDDDISSDGDAEVGGKGKGGEKREEDDNVDDDYGEQRDGKMMGMGSTMLRAACQSNLEETCGIEKRGRFPTGYMDEPVLFPLFCVKEIMMPPEEVPTYHDDVSLFMHMFPFQEYDDWAKSAMKQQYDLGGSRACDRTSKLLEACEHNNMEINFCKGTAVNGGSGVGVATAVEGGIGVATAVGGGVGVATAVEGGVGVATAVEGGVGVVGVATAVEAASVWRRRWKAASVWRRRLEAASVWRQRWRRRRCGNGGGRQRRCGNGGGRRRRCGGVGVVTAVGGGVGVATAVGGGVGVATAVGGGVGVATAVGGGVGVATAVEGGVGVATAVEGGIGVATAVGGGVGVATAVGAATAVGGGAASVWRRRWEAASVWRRRFEAASVWRRRWESRVDRDGGWRRASIGTAEARVDRDGGRQALIGTGEGVGGVRWLDCCWRNGDRISGHRTSSLAMVSVQSYTEFKDDVLSRMEFMNKSHAFLLYHYLELTDVLGRLGFEYGLPLLPKSNERMKGKQPKVTCDARLLEMFDDCFSSRLMELK